MLRSWCDFRGARATAAGTLFCNVGPRGARYNCNVACWRPQVSLLATILGHRACFWISIFDNYLASKVTSTAHGTFFGPLVGRGAVGEPPGVSVSCHLPHNLVLCWHFGRHLAPFVHHFAPPCHLLDTRGHHFSYILIFFIYLGPQGRKFRHALEVGSEPHARGATDGIARSTKIKV